MTENDDTAPGNALARVLRSHPQTAHDYLEFRRILAGDAAAFAAQRASEDQIARLGQCMTEMEAAFAANDPTREAIADATFHLAILEAAGNAVLLHVMQSLYDMLRSEAFYDHSALFLRSGGREAFLRQHRAIFAAIVAHDSGAARTAADTHVTYAMEVLREARLADQRRETALRRRNGLALAQPSRRQG